MALSGWRAFCCDQRQGIYEACEQVMVKGWVARGQQARVLPGICAPGHACLVDPSQVWAWWPASPHATLWFGWLRRHMCRRPRLAGSPPTAGQRIEHRIGTPRCHRLAATEALALAAALAALAVAGAARPQAAAVSWQL
eukprot:356036-Chlamydomonas_euryale.AAC.3